jgi:maltooligosyltrehalose trehalohydrolase
VSPPPAAGRAPSAVPPSHAHAREDARLGAVAIDSAVKFALWSTTATTAGVRLYAAPGELLRTVPLAARGEGLFDAVVRGVGPGALYMFVLDDREVPDPYARFLPHGVHGPARVEPAPPPRAPFAAAPLSSWVIYELHLGTFTPEGTWRAALEKLDRVSELGVNAIEVMPIAAFDGARGWGYDGAALLAPFTGYGEPDDARAFVEACHARGIAVLVDVVLNHFGPAGNYLTAYAPAYFTSRHGTAWGEAPDYAEPHMRALALEVVRSWLEDYGFDGARLDATHAIHDDSARHILLELSTLARGLVPPRVLIAEDERNDPAVVTDHELDAVWADDFHHGVHVLLTNERDGYYANYRPDAAELARTITRGWLYEGQLSPLTKKPRGRPAGALPASSLVYCIQNHDQIGNRALGTRLSHEAGIDVFGAASMLLLFLPMVPLLFMGDEWAASTPFLYFTDHEATLGEAITAGRREEFAHFQEFSNPHSNEAPRPQIPDPQAASTFERSRLVWSEREQPAHARVLAIYKRMIGLRRSDPVLSVPSREHLACEARGPLLIARRWRDSEERWLVFNSGDSAAPFDYAAGDVLLSSHWPVNGQMVPPRAALLIARRPS